MSTQLNKTYVTRVFLERLSDKLQHLFGFHGAKHFENPVDDDLAIIIPDMNPNSDITSLARSICRQKYPKKHFECYLITPHKENIKSDVFEGVPVQMIEVSTSASQNEAIDACLRDILANKRGKYLATLVVDSESVLPENYLREMNNAIMMNRQIIFPRKRDKRANRRALFSNCMVRMDVIEESGGWPFHDREVKRNKKICRNWSLGSLRPQLA